MNVEIEHKVRHEEWDEVNLTLEQFIEFDRLYILENDDNSRYNLYPTFNFDNGSVWVDERWDVDSEGRLSTSSYNSGIMMWSEEAGQYIECYYGQEKELGQVVSINFRVEDDMWEILEKL